MERADEKKPTSWWAGWMARRVERRQEKETRERLRRIEERGEWGYIPPGCVLISKKTLAALTVLLAVQALLQFVILVGQTEARERLTNLEKLSAMQQLPQK